MTNEHASNEQASNEQLDEILTNYAKDTSGEDAAEVVSEESGLDPIEQLQTELAEMRDQFLRSVAENENLRKRAERDQAELRKYAVTEFARDMVAVCENLYRALDNMTPEMLEGEENKNLKNLHTGVDMTRNELLRGFEKHGIQRIAPQRGDVFDHNIHQAISQIEDSSVADGTVAQVIQAGYRIHDRLLQPSMVAVAKAPAAVDTSA